MLSRMPPKNTLESSRASSSLLWKCLRTFVYAFEPSPRKCEGEGSNEGFSAQYARSNLQSIYQMLQCELHFCCNGDSVVEGQRRHADSHVGMLPNLWPI